MKIDIALRLPQDAETVALVRTTAMGALANLGVTPDCVDDVRLALSEACTNVIEHSNSNDEYEVRLIVEDDQCEIQVIDKGEGSDSSTLGQPMPDPLSARGRGLAIIRAVVDAVQFESAPEAGTMVRLVKQLLFQTGAPLCRLRTPPPT